MRTFWLFRSNIKHLEYYHDYKNLNEFEKNCHDYYMLLPLWLLKNDYFDEVIIWRLSKGSRPDIKFEVNGKYYIQRWVHNFKDTYDYSRPDVSFWRGGFQEYDDATKQKPKHFGLKLYLGAGRRITSQWNGVYDVYLMEDERDFIKGKKCAPFYKTASPHIFHPIPGSEIKYDICWPANFAQIRHKGHEFFIEIVASNKHLKGLKIVHCGNKTNVGKKLCEKYNVNNIKFMGEVDRPILNKILNQSKFGLNVSNLQDGCPRVSTEVLMSGTPLILRNTVRLLNLYRDKGVLNITPQNMAFQILTNISLFKEYKEIVSNIINNEISFDNVNKKNIDLWKTL